MSFKAVHVSYALSLRGGGATLRLMKPTGQLDGVAVRVSVATGNNDTAPLKPVNAQFEPLWKEVAFDLSPADLKRAARIAVEARFIIEEPSDATGTLRLAGTLELPGATYVDCSVDLGLNVNEVSPTAGLIWWLEP